jgi:hypothetical protein
MCAKCIQPVSTFTSEKIKCRGLNQIETKMQHEGENKVCDMKQMNRWLTTNHSPTPLAQTKTNVGFGC